MSAVAQELSPPEKRSWIKHLFGGLLLSLIIPPFVVGIASLFVFLGMAAFAIYLSLTGFRFNRDEWPMLHANWQASFLCDRCGTVFIPAAG